MKLNLFAKPLLALVLGGLGAFSVVYALDWPTSEPTGEVPHGKVGDWGYDLRTLMAPDNVDAPITAVGIGNVSDIGDGRYQATISDGSGSGGQALLFDVEGPLGAEFYCDEDGLNCVTASALATTVAGGSTATAVQALSDPPGSPSAGDVYYDTDDDELYVWDGDSWEPFMDGLGDHLASQTLNINTQNIDGANFDVSGASGNTTIGGTLNVAGSTQLGADGTDGSLVIYSDDVGGDHTYTIQPGVATGDVVLTLPVDDGTPNQVLQTDGDGNLSWVTQTSGSDDLGDHVVDLTLDLNTQNIDGANFDVTGATGDLTTAGAIQTGVDGTDGSLVIYSDDVGGDYTYTIQPGVATGNVVLTLPVDDGTPNQVLQTDGDGNLSWVTQTSGADDLGDHVVDLTLDLNTQDIDGANFDVIGASGNTTIGGTLNVTGSTQLGADGADGSLVIYSDDVGGDFTYTIQPGVATGNVVLTLPVDDGTPNQVLQTDGSGVLTWVTQASGADNLGNHTATTNILLSDQYLSNDGGNEGIRVDDAGNVGIMTAPSGTYELEVNGDLYTENIYGTSDARLKRNIIPLTNALEKVAQMQGVSYRWKDVSKGDSTYLGVIAQEVEGIYPQVVQTDDEGYKAVNYGSVVAPLIEAVKELKERNEALEQRVGELESLLDR